MAELLTRDLVSVTERYPERIVQVGGGNFLRGFVDWVVDILNEETDFGSGIVLVKATPGSYDALDEQDCLFTTYLHGIRDGEFSQETRLISAVNRTVYPYQEYNAYLALARQDAIRFIFSNTTESGIVFSADDKLDDDPPATFPAKLTRFLYERYRHFAGAADKGCIIIPTELIVDNASRLREYIPQYADLWGLDPASRIGSDATISFAIHWWIGLFRVIRKRMPRAFLTNWVMTTVFLSLGRSTTAGSLKRRGNCLTNFLSTKRAPRSTLRS